MSEVKPDYERGNRISNRRKDLGLSQNELALRIDIGRQALSAIENGGSFKVEILDRLVSALDVSCEYILHGGAEESKNVLLAEAVNVLSDMDEIQIRQFIAMMKASNSVLTTK